MYKIKNFTLLKSLREATGRTLMRWLAKTKPNEHNTKILRMGSTANCNKVVIDESRWKNTMLKIFESICLLNPLSATRLCVNCLPQDVH